MKKVLSALFLSLFICLPLLNLPVQADVITENNGNEVVRYGDYYYYICAASDSSSEKYTQICRMNLNGSNCRKVCAVYTDVGKIFLYGNRIYYNESGTIYSVKTDGTDIKTISKGSIDFLNTNTGTIYGVEVDSLFSIDPNGKNKQILHIGVRKILEMDDERIYFEKGEGYSAKLCSVKKDGSSFIEIHTETMIGGDGAVEIRIDKANILHDFIFYIANVYYDLGSGGLHAEDSRLLKVNKNGGEHEVIYSGEWFDFKVIDDSIYINGGGYTGVVSAFGGEMQDVNFLFNWDEAYRNGKAYSAQDGYGDMIVYDVFTNYHNGVVLTNDSDVFDLKFVGDKLFYKDRQYYNNNTTVLLHCMNPDGSNNVLMNNLSAMQKVEKDIKVSYKGAEIEFDQPPIIQEGRTLVPVRALFEALGANVDWDGNTRTATAQKDGILIKIQIDNLIMIKNDEEITLDVPAKIIGGRTLVPLRAISQAFGTKVDWDPYSRIITISN